MDHVISSIHVSDIMQPSTKLEIAYCLISRTTLIYHIYFNVGLDRSNTVIQSYLTHKCQLFLRYVVLCVYKSTDGQNHVQGVLPNV